MPSGVACAWTGAGDVPSGGPLRKPAGRRNKAAHPAYGSEPRDPRRVGVDSFGVEFVYVRSRTELPLPSPPQRVVF